MIFDMPLEQHDPLRVLVRAEYGLRVTLIEAEDAVVDVVVALVVARIRLNDDHQVVRIHSGAQRRRDPVECEADQAFELFA